MAALAIQPLTDKQVEANKLLGGPQRHLELVGGGRSGKTTLFVRAILVRACRAPGSRHVIFRLRYNAVRRSIWLDTLPKVLKQFFPHLYVKWHEQDGYVTLPNGSEIWVSGLDDKERVERILGMEFCVDRKSKMLTSDLGWVDADSLKIGDELIGFPENIDGHIKLERSTVTGKRIIKARRFRIVTDKGSTIVSEQHRFVAYYDDRRHVNFRSCSWRMAKDLKVGDDIKFACKPWEADNSYEAGWLAGIFDGEGWLCKSGINSSQLGVAQNPGTVLNEILAALDARGIPYYTYQLDKCTQVFISGVWNALKLLGTIHPKRLFPRNSMLWEGIRAFVGPVGKQKLGPGIHRAKILEIEDLGEGEVVALQTSSKTFIADGFLGHNCTIFFNECSQIPYSSVLLALTRLSQRCPEIKARAYYDLNPIGKGHWTYKLFIENKSPESLLRLPDPENYAHLFMNPIDNKANIDEEYIKSFEGMPTRVRMRFLEGKYIEQYDGQLWTLESIDADRVDIQDLPPIKRIVVAVDPSGAKGQLDVTADEIGICVCAEGDAPIGWGGTARGTHGYFLEDQSGLYSPEQWGMVVAQAYHKWHADKVIAEKNFGGDMVRAVIHAADPNVAVELVDASRGKVVRAEPIAAIAEQHRLHNVGHFPKLEDELTNFTTAGYMGGGSPNHADAYVWGFTKLFPAAPSYGLFGLWREQAEKLAETEKEGVKVAVSVVENLSEIARAQKGLSDAQKEGVGWMEQIKGLNKVAKTTKLAPAANACPQCGNTCPSLYSESWKCNACGAAGLLENGNIPVSVA